MRVCQFRHFRKVFALQNLREFTGKFSDEGIVDKTCQQMILYHPGQVLSIGFLHFFTSVDLGGYLAGALTLIGRSVENNGSFSVVDFIVNQMADEIAGWIEGQLLNGTGTNAAQGALNTTNVKTAAAAAVITADELIDLQSQVKQAFQANACWTMHPETFAAVKKLKDRNDRYLLQDDITGAFPYRLLGKPVHLSDNMPKMATGNKAILYGDYSGLSVNFRENISIEVLREKYATMHAIGVVSWFEFDAKVTDSQKLAALQMAAQQAS